MDNLNEKVDSLRDELVAAVQQTVQLRSVEGDPTEEMPYGPKVALALSHILGLATGLGFTTRNLDGYVGYAEYGSGEDYVAVLGHFDVVPEGSGWKYPPYGGEIHEGKIYGRGVVDDKGPTLAALYGLKAIKVAGLKLSKRVRILFGTNEETGCNEISHYLKTEKPPVAGFTPDADYPVIYAEKGIMRFAPTKKLNPISDGSVRVKRIKGGERPNIVCGYAEATLEASSPDAVLKACTEFARTSSVNIKATANGNTVLIQSHGVSAHASRPQLGKNAITQLVACLAACDLSGDIAAYINAIHHYIGNEINGHSLGIGFSDEPSGSLTLNVGIIDVNEHQASITCDVRYPVTCKFDQLIAPVEKNFNGSGIEVDNITNTNPLYYPKDHPLIQTLSRVFTEQTGIHVDPIATGGGTYAKTLPNIVGFGPNFPGKKDYCHQPDEHMTIEDLILNAKIYAHAIYELAK
ncbi:Beta-Ala-Xaa dipeptidase [Sporomusa rhizae]|uniref:dipeptidase PepV n=1 Tax=Sporomusa rhizae TaxID=357999 RepID=UPI00352A8A87